MAADISKLLTAAEQSFLRDQKIQFANVFDARKMSKRQRESHAEDTGQRFMIGVTCEKGGHRLRTKNGHCIQCDTSKIAHLLRFSETGYVYISGSLKTKTIKIGSSKVPDERHRKNEYNGYGGADDWEPLFEARFENAARVESDAQSRLNRYRVTTVYMKDRTKEQTSRESFTCSFTEAMRAVMATKEKQLTNEWISPRTSIYEFVRLQGKAGSNG